MPMVSVIVPNYNHAAFLKERIESILAQTYQDSRAYWRRLIKTLN